MLTLKKYYTGNDDVICEQDATIKVVDAPTQLFYNEDHGNDKVIFEEDTKKYEYMFSGQGMLNTIKIYLHHYFNPLLNFHVTNQCRMGKRNGNKKHRR